MSSQASFGFAEILGPSVGGIMYDAGGFLLPFEVLFLLIFVNWRPTFSSHDSWLCQTSIGIGSSLPINRSVHFVPSPHSYGRLHSIVVPFILLKESPSHNLALSPLTPTLPFNQGAVFYLFTAFIGLNSRRKWFPRWVCAAKYPTHPLPICPSPPPLLPIRPSPPPWDSLWSCMSGIPCRNPYCYHPRAS